MTTAPAEPPFFSVIVPTYNRAAMMARVLGSLTRQSFSDWEALVVDDASSDHTEGAVRALGDPRIRYLRHPVNRGVCAARNTALDAARGRWCLLVDSDFELLDGAMQTLSERCNTAAPDVGNLATLMSWDDGPPTPLPIPDTDLTLEYRAFIRWQATLRITEYFNCIRREVFDRVRFPSGRAYEASFHLDLARHFTFVLARERCCLAHTDARDRITRGPALQRARRLLRDAPDWSESIRGILRDHGDAIVEEAPHQYDRMLVTLADLLLLKGDRLGAVDALRRTRSSLGRRPRTLAIAALGMLDRRVLALAHGLRA
jgi:glycosyltransferase involved in cell wall biosynthesis